MVALVASLSAHAAFVITGGAASVWPVSGNDFTSDLNALGYNHMFQDMFQAFEEGTSPMETFYDGYVVNAIMDACYKSSESKKWEPVELEDWRGSDELSGGPQLKEYDKQYYLIKEEIIPDGTVKLILKDKASGEIIQKIK